MLILTIAAVVGSLLVTAYPAEVLARGNSGGNEDPVVSVVPPGSWRAAWLGGYPNLANDWWTWSTGRVYEGDAPSPLLDETGELCDQNQGGRVFYLAGTIGGLNTVERDCTVPKGKHLFFPLFSNLQVAEAGGGSRVEDLRATANSVVETTDGLELTVTVDGVPIGDLFAYRAQSPPGGGKYLVEPGSLFAAIFDPGVYDPIVSDGYWVLLEPLSPGEHVIVFTRDSLDFDSKSITYNLTVERRHYKRHHRSWWK